VKVLLSHEGPPRRLQSIMGAIETMNRFNDIHNICFGRSKRWIKLEDIDKYRKEGYFVVWYEDQYVRSSVKPGALVLTIK